MFYFSECFHYDIACPGNDIISYDHVDDEMECQSLCQANSQCAVFCYLSAKFPVQSKRRKCFLKTSQSVPMPTSDKGRILGLKCCPGQSCDK